MKAITAGLTLLLAVFTSDPAAAQQRPAERPLGVAVEDAVNRSGIAPALDSVVAVSTPELERSLEQLAQSLEVLRSRIVNDPELRASALRAAQGLTEVAEALVIQHSKSLQDALRAAAARLEELSVRADTTAKIRQ